MTIWTIKVLICSSIYFNFNLYKDELLGNFKRRVEKRKRKRENKLKKKGVEKKIVTSQLIHTHQFKVKDEKCFNLNTSLHHLSFGRLTITNFHSYKLICVVELKWRNLSSSSFISKLRERRKKKRFNCFPPFSSSQLHPVNSIHFRISFELT